MDLRKVLPADIVLDGKYRIERVIGAGGFGVTYAAHDLGLNTTVALKEFYPAELGVRDTTMTVRPKSQQEQPLFERLRQSFLAEARVLARFRHPSIVRVLSVFEAHGTAYMAMEFEEGRNLKSWLRNLGHKPTQAELDAVFYPLLDAIEAMHENNFLHRDIAPDNIIIRSNGAPVLLDFGAARRVVTERSSQMTGLIKQGYSPYEQYSTDGKLQGPWSDIYALGATLYHLVMGAPPIESTVRVIDDQLLPATTAQGDYRSDFLEGIDAAMRVRPTERPQTIAELRDIMFGDIGVPVTRTSRPRVTHPPPAAAPVQQSAPSALEPSFTPPPEIAARSRSPLLGVVLTGALAAGAFAAYMVVGPGGGPRISTAITQDQSNVAAPSTAAPQPPATPPAPLARPDTATPAPPIATPPATTPSPPPAPRASTSVRDALRNQVAPPPTSDEQARQREQAFNDRLARERRELEQRLRDQIENERKEREQAEARRRETERLARERQEKERADAQRQTESGSRQTDDAFRDALQLATGSGGTQDYARARPLFETAANGGRADAMNWLGRIYLNGLGTAADPAKAWSWFERAANAGDVASMAQLGQLFYNGQGVTKDLTKARDWFARAAAAGNTASQHQLGTIYYHGIGTAKDLTKAIDYFSRAARNGDVQSMLNLAHIYRTGAGGGQADLTKAREWYERAAAAGHSGAMNQLGVIFNDGLGVAKNPATARSWFERGVTNGNTFAMWNLARLLNSGAGGKADYPRTAQLLLSAAKQGGLDQVNRELAGNMARWHRSTRTEIKRELKRVGVYTGVVNDIWDENTRKAVALYRTR
ncbi:MAG: protein kinase [Hyphomicrobiaceae bacterium]